MDYYHLVIERVVVMIVLVVCAINRIANAAAYQALFAFGDSILDTGNNNLLPGFGKCNYPPYGRDFEGGKPTGRWSNGKVPTDLIAEALGIKQIVPAYRDPLLKPEDLPTGVCFASGGSGADPFTSTALQVIALSTQVKSFKEYIGKLTATVGQQKASEIISNSLVLLSAGNNDIAITYSQLHLRPMLFPQYSNLLIGFTTTFLNDIYALGVRHVWLLSTLPLGCLPGGRATVGGLFCNEFANGLATAYNSALQQFANSIRTTNPSYDVQYADFYTPLYSIATNPAASGFIDAANGCCGGAALAFGELCTLLTGQCLDPAQFVFWDFAHPTQRSYEIMVASVMQKHALQKQNSSLAS